jgi:uncharacterized protein YegP (UPF0339 family)
MKRAKFVIQRTPNALANNQRWWWNFVAPNGEIVCTSEMLSTKQACRKAIKSVKRGFLARVIVK